MVFQPKILRVFGAALGLYNVLGAQGHWVGPMGEPGNLARRDTISCSAGFVACGNSGCLDESQCCNQDTGWYCPSGNGCYTVTGTVDCYSKGGVVPSTARSCHDYAESSCGVGDGCFRCVYSTAPYCYTEVLYGVSQIWLDCFSSASLTVTVGSQTLTDLTATPTVSGSGFTTPTGYSYTTTPVVSPTTTPKPTTSPSSTSPSPTSTSRPISGGAIAGISIGGFGAIAIIGVLGFLLWKKSQNKQQVQHPQPPQMEPVQYQPPLTPAPGLPQYQPVAGQPVGLHNSYQEPPKGYYPPQSQYGEQSGGAYGQSGGAYGQSGGAYGQAGGAYGQTGEVPPRAEVQGSPGMYTQGGPAELS